MKLVLAIASALAFTASAHAEVFTCSFTEPYVTVTYTTGTQQLSIDTHGLEQDPPPQRHVGFLVLGPASFRLVDREGRTLADMWLNYKGGDESGAVYPYEMKFYKMSGANEGLGGCESLKLKKKPGEL